MRVVRGVNWRASMKRQPIDAGMLLALAMGGLRPGAIERQERQGQADLVASSRLPISGLLGPERATWEAMGIEIDDTPSDDDLFVNVKLPPGWRLKPTDHDMWSDLLDAKDRARARIFYKAAFYDRRAFIRPVTRFSIEQDYDRGDNVYQFQVKDGEKVAYTSQEAHRIEGRGPDVYDQNEALRVGLERECAEWLKSRGVEDYKNPALHWDAEIS
jgi:hypothetical protein